MSGPVTVATSNSVKLSSPSFSHQVMRLPL